ncbi:hypothetical protein [Paenibacillus sp. ISL-20]|uniref:hypothetical protein n=1 Tax=Paenibacillus sp. ISL-20 TaxID=2819163 RepID=UPI001BED302B|nr:hypothetical protein [Paenibacillus sp. ISL-20]MBT2759950.1 hypothetical protein [Paenibacillus sp. ISL-20]
MDKNKLAILNDYYRLEQELFAKLDKLVGENVAEELMDSLVGYREHKLKIGKSLDLDIYVGKDGFLKRQFENIPSYTSLHVIYEYDNGLSLCEAQNGFELIPQELISFETE